jgi:hypothetical protein
MDRKLVYSAYGALILAAGAFGVHVGESAIGQINPPGIGRPSTAGRGGRTRTGSAR